MKYFFSIVLLLTGISQIAFCQDQVTTTPDISYIDVVYMKDGSEFRGTIVEYIVGESVKIKLLGGHEIVFSEKQIKKIIQERQDCTETDRVKQKREYSFRENGVYNSTTTSTFNNIDEFGNVTLGLGINHVVGYQVNRFIGVGIGSGYDNFILGNAVTSIPLYLEARGYILKANTTPYYSINAGVGFPLKREEFNISGGSPGLLFHPAIGYRIGAGPASFVVDVGYKIQKLTLEYRPTWEQKRLEHHTIKRLAVRIGVLF